MEFELNFDHPAMAMIIDLLADNILESIKNGNLKSTWNQHILDKMKTIEDVKSVNWINFSPGFDQEDIDELEELKKKLEEIEKHGKIVGHDKESPRDVKRLRCHYFYYHISREVAMIMFVHYRSLGEDVYIITGQDHTYLYSKTRKVKIDWTSELAGVNIQNPPETEEIYTSLEEYAYHYYVRRTLNTEWEKEYISVIREITKIL